MGLKLKIVLLIIVSVKQIGFAWGFHGHKLINRQAVFSIPNGPLFTFFKSNIDFITEQSVNPDKRRYTQEDEACRHYIDMEAYFDSTPSKPVKYYHDAEKKYSKDSLKKHGILPWQIYRVQGMLSKAMQEKDALKILQLASDLGHYIGDAHVPLHTTKNYDGQLSNQKGIHALWETRLPEMFSSDYDLFVGRASYVPDVQKMAWEAVFASNRAVDSVLSLEAAITSQTPSDKKYAFEDRNNVIVRVYSESFTKKYSQQLSGQVERRMASAIKMVADLWYTAWVDAGQPDLSKLSISKETLPEMEPNAPLKNDRFLESHRNCSHNEPHHLLTLKHN